MTAQRCPAPCGKIRFTAEHKAILAAIGAALHAGPKLRAYRASGCGCWHLATADGDRASGKIKAFRPDTEIRP